MLKECQETFVNISHKKISSLELLYIPMRKVSKKLTFPCKDHDPNLYFRVQHFLTSISIYINIVTNLLMNSPSAKYPHSNSSTPASLLILLDELIAEILYRLPVKTLMQLKCVCKSWKTLISHPSFTKLHLHLLPRNTHVLLLPD